MKKLIIFAAVLALMTVTTKAQTGAYALEFGGTKYVNCGNNASVSISGTAISVEVWVYPTAFSTNLWENVIVNKLHNTSHGYNLRCGGNGIVEFYVSTNFSNTGFATSGEGAIELNKWTHLAGTYDGANVKLYINGKLTVTTAFTQSIPAQDMPLIIGNHGDTRWLDRPFIGKIDEVRLWNVARSEAEIKANMYKEIGTHTNLKAYYKMSDGSGTSLNDNSGNSNTGTLVNSPTWKLSGAFAGPRQALDFDGTDDYVNCGNTLNTSLTGTNNFTVEAWAYLTVSGGPFKTIIGNYGGNSDLQFLLRIDAGIPRFFTSNSYGSFTYLQIDKNMPLNTWTHFAGTWDGTTMKFYMNGKLEKTGSQSGSFPAISNSVKIGYNSLSEYFSGKIDEVRVWNTTRTETQIRENMCKNMSGNETGLSAYYRMDQKDGTTLYDQTANALNGTLTNMDAATDWVASTAFNTWLGGESSALGTAANWSNGVPSATDNVGVYKWDLGNELNVSSEVNTASVLVSATANPTLDAAINTTGAFIPLRNVNLKFTTNNAIGSINNPTDNELIVPADAKVTVSTSIDNSGKIILKSNDTNSAQIKNTGSAPTPGTVILRKDLKASSGWYFVSFPFDVTLTNIKKTSTQTDVTIGDYKTATGPTYSDLYIIEYNGARRDATGTATATNSPNWDAVTNGILSAKKGYAIRVMSDIEIDFIGTTNADMFANSDKTATIGDQHTNGNVIHHGWNLVGIPYTTAFNINNLSQGAYFYVYDQNNQNYMVKEKNVDTYQLNAFGAFFMQASSTNLTFANAGRALKAPTVVNVPEYTKIDLAITNGTFTDNAQIRLMEGAANTYELNKDAAKMLSMNGAVPQLWTKAETFDVAINALPENTQEVKLGMRLGSTGSYTIRINDISQNQTAILVDNLTGNRINLAKDKSYSFNSNTTGTISDRFKIITGSDVSTAVPSSLLSENIKIEINKENLIFSGLEENSTIRIYDTKSIMLATYSNVQNFQALKFSTTSNIILVVVENKCGIKTFKLHTNF